MSANDLFGPQLRDNPYWESYLNNLNMTPLHLDNEDELKHIFPKDREIMILTNGEDIIQVNDDNVQSLGSTDTASASADELVLLDAFAALKAKRPDLPVYNIHNHPKGENIVNGLMQVAHHRKDYEDLMQRENKSMQDLINDQATAGLLASQADAEMFYSLRHFMNGAIYHQDSRQVMAWSTWNDEARGTKFGVYPHQYRDVQGNIVKSGTWDIYLADETEDIPGVTYINFEDWPEEKSKYMIDKRQIFSSK